MQEPRAEGSKAELGKHLLSFLPFYLHFLKVKLLRLLESNVPDSNQCEPDCHSGKVLNEIQVKLQAALEQNEERPEEELAHAMAKSPNVSQNYFLYLCLLKLK